MEKIYKSKATFLVFALIFTLFTLILQVYNNKNNEVLQVTRTITVDEIDYQSMLENEFDNYEITYNNNTIFFIGDKNINESFLNELDNLSQTDKENLYMNVNYKVNYDYENNYIYLTCTLTKSDGTQEVEKFIGATFINDNIETDAIFNIEGEAVLLS
jgi:hypothetical protein